MKKQEEQGKRVIKSFLKGLKINKIMTVTEWAEQNRYLSSDISAEGGLYRVSRTPYFREIMDALSETSTKQRVVVMMGSQLGKSEAGNNFIGYSIDQVGGSIMVVQPTEDAVKKFLRQRIDPMIENCPSLIDKFKRNYKKMVDNTTQKDYIGGTITLSYSTSASTLASTPVKILFLDEIDRFVEDVGNEGDPVNLAIRRTSTFVDRKILMVSTPTLEHKSKIYKEYLKGDCKHFYMTCPHCEDDRFEFQKENFHYKTTADGETYDEHFTCPVCSGVITESQKFNLVKNGRWIATQTAKDDKIASYYLNSAYSLLGYSWHELSSEIEEGKNDDDKYKTVENTLWGLPYRENVLDTIGTQELIDIRVNNDDTYDDKLEDDEIYINMTVDTQDDRLCYLITSYNNKNVRKVLKYGELYGDINNGDLFKVLDTLAATRFFYRNDPNRYLPISSVLIDSGGHYTSTIYKMVNSRGIQWKAIKGFNHGPIYKESDNAYLNTDASGKPFANSKKLTLLNVFLGKKNILASLKISDPKQDGYIHMDYKKLEPVFFDMVTSEYIIRKRKNGIYVDEFKKDKERNEALDLLCYSYCDVKARGILDLADENIERYKQIHAKYLDGVEAKPQTNKTGRKIIQPDWAR